MLSGTGSAQDHALPDIHSRQTGRCSVRQSTQYKQHSISGFVLEINDLHAGIGDREILRGITLRVNVGEVHAVMLPNGSGKSTLAQVLAGNPSYEVTKVIIRYNGHDLVETDHAVRAQNEIFLAIQS